MAKRYVKEQNKLREPVVQNEKQTSKENKPMESKHRKTNKEKLAEIRKDKPPLIFVDIETTGIMNGNDNHITQLAMTAYSFNRSTERYELQDNIFLLAKAHPDTLHGIEVKGAPTKENAARLLKNEYVDAYRQEITRGYTNISNRIKTLENKISKREEQIENCTERQVKKKEGYEADLARYKNNLAKEQAALAEFQKLRSLVFDENDIPIDYGDTAEPNINKLIKFMRTDAFIKERGDKYPTSEVVAGIYTFAADDSAVYKDAAGYIDSRLESKIKTLENESLDNVLSVQGIDKGKWIKEGLGLTTGEIQVGINEFLKKYDNDPNSPAAYITNGTYYTTHYLSKDNLSIFDVAKKNVFDLYQHEKWQSESENKWTANVGTFAKMYEQRTGKTIKTFDAFTKALCYAEMTSEIMSDSYEKVSFVNHSVNQLANAVAEKVASMDEDYVMSAARASALNWRVASQYDFEHSDYKFNNLDYVDFGTERKYVDIDKLFEVNNNFEVTLEGEKEPIKSWEELEDKIKALNANISEGLLEQIKCKYEEIEMQAQEAKREAVAEIPEDKYVPEKVNETVDRNSSSVLQQTLSTIISDFEDKYEKATEEMKSAQAELDEIQHNTNLTKSMSEDLAVIGNFVQTVYSKIGKFNDSEKRVICSAWQNSAGQNKTNICLYDTSLASNPRYFNFPKIDIENTYSDNKLVEIKLAYTEGGTENPFNRDNDSFHGGFYMSINIQNNTVDFTKGKEAVFTEILENWDSFKNRIIEGSQRALDHKVLIQQNKTQNIKESIKKIKNVERG